MPAPMFFEKDPGSVACPGFIPPTVVPEAVKARRLQAGGPSQFHPLRRRLMLMRLATAGFGNTHCVSASGSRIPAWAGNRRVRRILNGKGRTPLVSAWAPRGEYQLKRP